MNDKFPFGNPEGARSSLAELEDSYIPFSESPQQGTFRSTNSDLSVRIIVGAKGSGKTVYLRRLHAQATVEPSVFASEIETEPLSTESTVAFCSSFREKLLTEKWSQLWHLAILRSIVSLLCFAKEFTDYVPEELRENLLSYKSFLGLNKAPVQIYASATYFARLERSSYKITQILENPLLDEVEYFAAQALRDTPPIYYFLDGIDENFRRAPMHWLRCQKGLVLRTMQLLRDQRFGGRLHVITTCRDHVLASLYRGEHQNRFRGEPHIKLLTWNYRAVEHFLNQKVEQLPAEMFIDSENRTIASWLGHETIKNGGRSLREPIGRYLIRHTRLLPRDIVQIGNALAREVVRARALREERIGEKVIRRVTAQAAATFGNEQLDICVSQMRSSAMPAIAGQQGFSDFYTGDDEFRESEVKQLKELIRLIGVDEFHSGELEVVKDEARDVFGRNTDVFSVLWQNRLLGCRRLLGGEERIFFYSEEYLDSFALPDDAISYVFHPCVIDSVGIKSVVKEPLGSEDFS
ncbi:MAG: hypothetical protein AAFN07_15005 [Pseudomonadota bacterium]